MGYSEPPDMKIMRSDRAQASHRVCPVCPGRGSADSASSFIDNHQSDKRTVRVSLDFHGRYYTFNGDILNMRVGDLTI